MSNPVDILLFFASWVILHAFLLYVDFFLKWTFSKKSFRNTSECQTVWVQVRPDILSGLIWVQTVSKGYKQTTKVATNGERVKANVSPWKC